MPFFASSLLENDLHSLPYHPYLLNQRNNKGKEAQEKLFVFLPMCFFLSAENKIASTSPYFLYIGTSTRALGANDLHVSKANSRARNIWKQKEENWPTLSRRTFCRLEVFGCPERYPDTDIWYPDAFGRIQMLGHDFCKRGIRMPFILAGYLI